MRAHLARVALALAAALAPGSRFVCFRAPRREGAKLEAGEAPPLGFALEALARAALPRPRPKLARAAALALLAGLALACAMPPSGAPHVARPRSCAEIMRRAGASPSALCSPTLRVKRNGTRTNYTIERD